MAKTTELEAAYQATTYRVFLPGGCCELRTGVASETLRCWLETAGAGQFAILSAHNPGSRRIDDQENAIRQSQLECELLEAGFEPYVGENISADATWPAEETCFVAGITLAEALAFGQRFGQNAIVHGGDDGLPVLVWIDQEAGQETAR